MEFDKSLTDLIIEVLTNVLSIHFLLNESLLGLYGEPIKNNESLE